VTPDCKLIELYLVENEEETGQLICGQCIFYGTSQEQVEMIRHHRGSSNDAPDFLVAAWPLRDLWDLSLQKSLITGGKRESAQKDAKITMIQIGKPRARSKPNLSEETC
jgi:hypothetical protein